MDKKAASAIVRELKQQYKEYGIKIILNPHEYYLDGVEDQESSAYFDYANKIIHVSTKDRAAEEWLINLLHETSHADQMLVDSQVWRDNFINGIDIEDIAQLWMDGYIDLNSYHQRPQLFRAMMRLELNAERRAVEKIIHYNLHEFIDIKHYIQCAHAYALGYVVAGYVKAWIPASKAPYTIPELVNKMPTEFTELENVQIMKLTEQFREFYPELFNTVYCR